MHRYYNDLAELGVAEELHIGSPAFKAKGHVHDAGSPRFHEGIQHKLKRKEKDELLLETLKKAMV